MDNTQLGDQSSCTDEEYRCNGVFDCENNADEENCSFIRNTASTTVAPVNSSGDQDRIFVSEGAIWTLVVSIIVVFLLVALIMWFKFKSDKNQSDKRPRSFGSNPREPASSRVAGIDRRRRQQNLNIERPESYHYNSRPSSMIYTGSQDNMRSISSQLSWYSQQLYPIPQRTDGSLSFLNAPVILPHTTIDHINEITDNNDELQLDASPDNDTNLGSMDTHSLTGDPNESRGNLRPTTAVIIPTSPPPHYVDLGLEENHTGVTSELLEEHENGVSPPPTYSECNDDNNSDDGNVNDTCTPLRVSDATATPPPTYTDSLSYNFITYV